MIVHEEEQATQPVRVLTSQYYQRLVDLERSHWWWRGMRRITDRLLDRLTLPARGIRVLDAGCGTGLTLSRLEALMGARPQASDPAIGLDFSADALRWCRGRGHQRLIRGDASRLPFATGSFDLVVSLDVLQHLPRPHGDRQALAEFARVLAPNGALLLRTNSRCGHGEVDAADYHRYRLHELRGHLKEAGFSVVVSSYVNLLPALATSVARRMVGAARATTDPGLPAIPQRPSASAKLGYGWLALEASYLRVSPVALPYGHSIVALARATGRGSGRSPG